MRYFKKRTIFYGFLLTTLCYSFITAVDWGFFAHRRINRLAVFTLPIELIPFYKEHIDYLTINAVAPDKRRYVVPTEGIRHYIDLDRWGVLPFDNLPRNILAARQKYIEVVVLNEAKDSLVLFGQRMNDDGNGNWSLTGKNYDTFFGVDSLYLVQEDYDDFFYQKIYNPLYEENWSIDCEVLKTYFDRYDFKLPCTTAIAIDTFVEHGVLPYNLIRLQRNLTTAMQEQNRDLILRLSADIGHYIGDAHVPLHTTSNYNGYQTDQAGIHAFWETRLPELFADDTYDYFVAKAKYIEDPVSYYWQIVLDSHALVESVLRIEKQLSQQFPKYYQSCFVERGAGAIQTAPCEAYAAKYHEALQGQVEQRMRSAIHTVGSAWYTAWIDAGQPDFSRIDRQLVSEDKKEQEAMEKAIKKGKIFGRKH